MVFSSLEFIFIFLPAFFIAYGLSPKKIKNAVIIETSSDTSFVHIGSKVRVYDEELEMEEVYEITGATESNAMENKISNESPVGTALLKRKVGDVIKINAPDGEYKLIIREIF